MGVFSEIVMEQQNSMFDSSAAFGLHGRSSAQGVELPCGSQPGNGELRLCGGTG